MHMYVLDGLSPIVPYTTLVVILLSLGGYFSWWTINLRRYRVWRDLL